jgi:hypothetical protein
MGNTRIRKNRPTNKAIRRGVKRSKKTRYKPRTIEPLNQNDKEAFMAVQEGKAAPSFTLPDADGNKISLKDFEGKNVILYFYPKDNTSG